MLFDPRILVLLVCPASQLLLGCNTRSVTGSSVVENIADTQFEKRLDECSTQLIRDEMKRRDIVDNLEFLTFLPRFCYWPSQTTAAEIDPHRSLIVHDRATLDAGDFSLQRTLEQIASQVSGQVPGTT